MFSCVDQCECVPYSARGEFEGEGHYVPHVVVRIYPEAGPLLDLIHEREAEVQDLMRSVPGFRSYGIVDTGGGILSVTSAESKEGTDASSNRNCWRKLRRS
jgi:hypothetical protein